MKAIQHLLQIDALLNNWQTICQLLLQDTDEIRMKELVKIATKLSEGNIDRALDDLYDLTEDTAAGKYVHDLLERHVLDNSLPSNERTRGVSNEFVADFKSRAAKMSSQDALTLRSEAQANIEEEPAFIKVPIFYATNRKKVESGSGSAKKTTYTGEQVHDLNLGLTLVTVPVACHAPDRQDRETVMVAVVRR